MKEGKKISNFDDYTGHELEIMNWTTVDYHGDMDDNEELHEWMKTTFENFDDDVRWMDSICVFFRKEEDAVIFKLTWL